MSNGYEFDKASIYQIKVHGIVKQKWEDWFDGFEICHTSGAETTLVGPVADQAALYGLLAKIRDLHLTLIYLRQMPI
jgi:hypothetical protein